MPRAAARDRPPRRSSTRPSNKQQDLLAEFEKIADELNRVLANLEGSTLVKRLKAASRLQYKIGGRIGDQVGDTFGMASVQLGLDGRRRCSTSWPSRRRRGATTSR